MCDDRGDDVPHDHRIARAESSSARSGANFATFTLQADPRALLHGLVADLVGVATRYFQGPFTLVVLPAARIWSHACAGVRLAGAAVMPSRLMSIPAAGSWAAG